MRTPFTKTVDSYCNSLSQNLSMHRSSIIDHCQANIKGQHALAAVVECADTTIWCCAWIANKREARDGVCPDITNIAIANGPMGQVTERAGIVTANAIVAGPSCAEGVGEDGSALNHQLSIAVVDWAGTVPLQLRCRGVVDTLQR